MSKKGFTLVELIIAIGMFMLASTLILQIYMTATKINEKASAVTHSVTLASQVIETVKTYPRLESIDLRSVLPSAVIHEEEMIISWQQHFDALWQPEPMESPTSSEGYVLSCTVMRAKPGLLDIGISVRQIKNDGTNKLLYLINAASLEEEEGGQ